MNSINVNCVANNANQLLLISNKAESNNKIKNFTMAILGSLVLALSAQITIPYQIVPISMQSFAVLLLAFLLGSNVGSMAVFFYLLEGLFGLPVFAGYSYGIATLLGPTSGYLLGFLPAVFVTGYLLDCKIAKNLLGRFTVSLIGMLLIFGFGYSILGLFVGYKTAFVVGVLPFIIIDLVKSIVFTCISKNKS